MRQILLSFALLFLFTNLYADQPWKRVAPKSFPIGIGPGKPKAPNGKIVLGTTVTGGSPTVTLASVCIEADSSATYLLNYISGTNTIHVRSLFSDSAGTSVKDQFGTVIVTPVPANILTDISNIITHLNTVIANGAAGGKLNL